MAPQWRLIFKNVEKLQESRRATISEIKGNMDTLQKRIVVLGKLRSPSNRSGFLIQPQRVIKHLALRVGMTVGVPSNHLLLLSVHKDIVDMRNILLFLLSFSFIHEVPVCIELYVCFVKNHVFVQSPTFWCTTSFYKRNFQIDEIIYLIRSGKEEATGIPI